MVVTEEQVDREVAAGVMQEEEAQEGAVVVMVDQEE